MAMRLALILMLLACCFRSDGQERLELRTDPEIRLRAGDSMRLGEHLREAYAKEEGDRDSAMAIYFRIFKTCMEQRYHAGADSALMYMHRCIWKRGMGRQHARWLRIAAEYSDHVGISPLIMAHILDDIGIYSMYGGQYMMSGYYFHKALTKLGSSDTGGAATALRHLIYCNLGALWGTLHEHRNALYWFNKAELLSTDTLKMATVAADKGGVFLNMGELDLAWKSSLKALDLCRQQGIKGTAATACLNLASILIERNKLREALQYLDLGYAEARAEKAGLQRNGQHPSAVIPNEFMFVFLQAKVRYLLGQPEEAKGLLLRAVQLQGKYGFRQDQAKTYEMLSDIYAEQGRYREAWIYHRHAARIQDSLLNVEKSRAVDAEIRYRTAEKDRMIALKELALARTQSSLRQRNILIVAVSAGSMLTIAFLFSLYRSSTHKQRLHAERMQLLVHEKEIGNLKAMMQGEEKERARLARELHDGIMVQLSAIKMRLRTFARQQKNAENEQELIETLRQLDSTTKELRQSAHSLMPDMLLESGLAEAIFYFCKNLQTGAGLRINFQQYGDIPRLQPEYEIALYRIVQELVQNIIKHSFATKGLIQFNYREGMLYITVEDNGRGFDVHTLPAGHGLGLKSIRTRMRALNGIMDISSNGQLGTSINLEFDVRGVIIPEKERYAY